MPITAEAFNGRLLVSITRSFCLIEWSSLAPNFAVQPLLSSSHPSGVSLRRITSAV